MCGSGSRNAVYAGVRHPLRRRTRVGAMLNELKVATRHERSSSDTRRQAISPQSYRACRRGAGGRRCTFWITTGGPERHRVQGRSEHGALRRRHHCPPRTEAGPMGRQWTRGQHCCCHHHVHQLSTLQHVHRRYRPGRPGRVVFALSNEQLADLKPSGGFPPVHQDGPYLFDEARIPVDGYYR